MKHIKKILCGVLLATGFIGTIAINADKVWAITQAQAREMNELIDKGVDPWVAMDEIIEKYHINEIKYSGTGGLDGIIPDWIAAKTRNVKNTSPTKPACSHEWTAEETKLATCTTEGEITQTCTKCGKQKKEKTPKADHDYILTETTVGDCLHETTYIYTCTKCGDTNIQLGEFGEHSYVETENNKQPTCTEDGYKEEKCTICKNVKGEILRLLGHSYLDEKEYIVTPTCTTEGKKAYKCQHCGYITGEEIIPATGHEIKVREVKKPTFFENGEEEDFCLNCKKVIETREVPATGGVWRLVIPISVIALIGSTVGIVIVKKKNRR